MNQGKISNTHLTSCKLEEGIQYSPDIILFVAIRKENAGQQRLKI